MEPRDRVRILVLGDAGVGKTSLVHQLAFATPAAASVTSTIGATLEVRVHEYREGTPQKKTFWIEFCDVGGFQSHRNARHVFYANAHGLILVHDLSNAKSQANLRNWLAEFMETYSGNAKYRDNFWDEGNGADKLDATDVNIPLLVVGTKLDMASEGSSLPTRNYRRSTVADEYLAEEIHVGCHDAKAFVVGSSAANKLARFLDKVIEKQFYRRDRSAVGVSTQERRRL